MGERSHHGGRGRGGRSSGAGRSGGRRYGSSRQHNRNGGAGSTSQEKKYEFAAYQMGKQQLVTFDTMKEYVILKIQKDYKKGGDIAEALRTGIDDVPGTKPIRQLVSYTAENSKTDHAKENLRLLQDGYDLDYTEALRAYNANREQYDDNKKKAYATIFGLCNKVMKSRIEEMSTFDTTIRNDPFELLNAIKEKMYDPARAKYEFVSLTDTFNRTASETRQDFDEDLLDYTKRFKQAKDILKQTTGDETLHTFVEHTKEYVEETK